MKKNYKKELMEEEYTKNIFDNEDFEEITPDKFDIIEKEIEETKEKIKKTSNKTDKKWLINLCIGASFILLLGLILILKNFISEIQLISNLNKLIVIGTIICVVLVELSYKKVSGYILLNSIETFGLLSIIVKIREMIGMNQPNLSNRIFNIIGLISIYYVIKSIFIYYKWKNVYFTNYEELDGLTKEDN